MEDNKTTRKDKDELNLSTLLKKGMDAETLAESTQKMKDSFPFVSQNNLVLEEVRGLGFVLRKLWGETGIAVPINSKSGDLLAKLSNIDLPSNLVALYHKDTDEYEFIYQPLSKSDKYANYKFDFTYNENIYTARFDTPSEEFKLLATRTFCSNEENEKRHRNIPLFFQYYSKDSSSLPEVLKLRLNLIFHDKIAINFFLKGNFSALSTDEQIVLFQHLNLMLYYFDRKSPQIIIIQDNDNIESYPIPNYSDAEKLPEKLNIKKLQDDLLDLLTTARNAPTVRLQYLYYFQVIEFCTYYFLTADIKHNIKCVLEDPSLLNYIDKHTQKLIDIIQDDYYNRHSEDDRLKCMFREYCSFEDIRAEIGINQKYFEKDIQFKGGYVVKKLFKQYANIDKNPDNVPSIMNEIYNNIIKIRNVLVHARESHQNTSISPCIENENQLKPYLYIVQRMAEIISRKFS